MAKKYSDIDLSQYNGGYTKSAEVLAAEKKKTEAENAVSSYGDFSYANQDIYKDVMNKILNREKFSYDLNGDALYQQYKDKFIQQGKMAMQDTMGQAAAMTGGYGNSYAATVGNQAYQAQLNNLNDIIPELYQMAYDKYNQEGQDLYNQYGMLSDDRNTEYGMWSDKYNRLMNDRTYYTDEANTAFNRGYGQWNDNRTYDQDQYWKETEYGYAQDRDAIADAQWQKTFDEGVRQFNEQQAAKKIVNDDDDDDKPKYEYKETDATKMFKASIKTKNEFYNRGGSDKATYGTYENYIKGIMDKWLQKGDLTDNDVATLGMYYGFITKE